jgi:dihydrofolate synthase / folylpolyglutamate synthase
MTTPSPDAKGPDPKGSDVILTRLMALHPKKIDLSLGRTLDLLDRLDRPQNRLPPVIHVAGTNGKGSTIAFLRAIMEAAGYRVHAYTSPHLVRFNERIRLAGNIIDETLLARHLGYCEKINEGRPITYFEITTAAAFNAFAETPGDVLLLETGLGGRFDSTNVVDHPALTVITPISIDHTAFLGPDLASIAAEKAAIQKPGIRSVIGAQPREAAQVIEDYANSVGAPLARHDIEWGAQGAEDGVRVRFGSKIRKFPPPGLLGAHQIHNAGLAIVCTEFLKDFKITNAAIAEGVRRVEWPGRLQRLRGGPLVFCLPADCEVWLDGGHNAAAGEALAAMIRDWDDRPLHMILGMLTSKDDKEFLRPLAPLITSMQTVSIPGEAASISAEDAAKGARALYIKATAAPNLEAAAHNLSQNINGPARVLICGSLYLAGVVLTQNG